MIELGDIDDDELLLLSHWSIAEGSTSFCAFVTIGWPDAFNITFFPSGDTFVLEADELMLDDSVLAVETFVELSWAGMLDAAAVRFGSVLIWIYCRGCCWIMLWWSARGTCGRAMGWWITKQKWKIS